MTRQKFAMACLIGLVWAGSMAMTYFHTREKWHELGKGTGEIVGYTNALAELCSIGTQGKPVEPVTLTLAMKAMFVDFTGQNGDLSIHCS